MDPTPEPTPGRGLLRVAESSTGAISTGDLPKLAVERLAFLSLATSSSTTTATPTMARVIT